MTTITFDIYKEKDGSFVSIAKNEAIIIKANSFEKLSPLIRSAAKNAVATKANLLMDASTKMFDMTLNV